MAKVVICKANEQVTVIGPFENDREAKFFLDTNYEIRPSAKTRTALSLNGENIITDLLEPVEAIDRLVLLTR